MNASDDEEAKPPVKRVRPTQLVDGNIPPGQACPYKDKCPIKNCNKQTATQTTFSCGTARGFDLVESYKNKG